MPDYEFRSGTIQLDPGDTLLLYTDGVNEAMNKNRQMFKVSAIEETLRAFSTGVPAESIGKTMIRKVEEFVGGAPQSDDITLLVVRYCDRKLKASSRREPVATVNRVLIDRGPCPMTTNPRSGTR